MATNTRTLTVERTTSTAHRLTCYDGACGNIHGHNMRWEAQVTVSMEDVGEDQMPLDLKDISEAIDETDHAILLSEEEQDIVERLLEQGFDAPELLLEDLFGDVIWFESDPTCENISQWMARKLYHIDDAVEYVTLTVAETDKYDVSTDYGEYDAMQEAAEDE
jgi:6-pyruvoyl-tetrahydropterin synthase